MTEGEISGLMDELAIRGMRLRVAVDAVLDDPAIREAFLITGNVALDRLDQSVARYKLTWDQLWQTFEKGHRPTE